MSVCQSRNIQRRMMIGIGMPIIQSKIERSTSVSLLPLPRVLCNNADAGCLFR